MRIRWAQTHDLVTAVVAPADKGIPVTTEPTAEPWGAAGPRLRHACTWVRTEQPRPGDGDDAVCVVLRKVESKWWDDGCMACRRGHRVEVDWTRWTDEDVELDRAVAGVTCIDDTFTESEKAARLQRVVELLRHAEGDDALRRRDTFEAHVAAALADRKK
jgi:hypothetical protein